MKEFTYSGMHNKTVPHSSGLPLSFWWQGLLLASSYFIVAKLGLSLTVVANNVTLIWPPSGLALFALLVFGFRFWPWVFLGALLTNLTTGIPAQAALMIALGNSLEAMSGFYLLRITGFHHKLHHVKDIMLLVLLAAGVSTMVSASLGSFSLAYFQIIPWSDFRHAWLSWWMGDAMGVLVFAPLLLSWWFGDKETFNTSRAVEVILLLLALILMSEFVFGNQFFLFESPLPLAFMTFPFLIWAAMRFGMRGATTAVLIVAGVILVNIIYEQGLFAQGSAFESLTLLWLYANFLAVTSMILAASVSERQLAEIRLRHLSQHDHLTGLRNRFSLQEDVSATIARAKRHDRQPAVLFMDLDHFKKINDSMGHSIGDQLLISVGQRLHGCMREEDAVYRQGGDEFIIILEDVQHDEDIGKIAKKIKTAVNQPFEVQGVPLHTSVSIGISKYPYDGKDVENLLKNADTAMYRAKDLGRNNIAFYSPEMNAQVIKKMSMETELREALSQQQFELHYQPQYGAVDGEIKGCEALLRWHKSESELVPPDDFIPVLEETGLIKQVGAWVIDAACAQLANWHAQGWDSLRMSVNISSYQLDDPKLLNHIQDCLHRYKLQPEWLELEITESMLVRHDPMTMKILKGLVDLNLRIAIDDFGTGYSSLSYLHRMSVDTLKIDRAFVANIPGDEDSEAIARAIVGLGKSVRLNLVAEGIETVSQATFLRELGCDLLQGYLFSKPVTADVFQQLLTEHTLPAVSAREIL